MSGDAAIEAIALEKSYGDVRVLAGIDLRVERGRVFALLGPNGAGKTTTVRILSTLIRPDGGRARVAGFDVVADRRRVRRAISLTGQLGTLRDDPAELTLGVATDGSGGHVRAVLDAVDPDGHAVAHFAVHTATLDDVFLALTGHTARTPDDVKEPSHV